ncbi:MAG TPA: hypothetical protein VGD14_12505 [bacterium]
MSILIPSLLALITAILTSFIGYSITKSKMKHEIITEQKYKYFLPFKSCAEDFRGRLIHIEKRLSEKSEKQKAMITRLDQKFNSREINWYFKDDVGPEGGYFITSTIYITCLLFYWIRKIQWESPFIELICKKNITEMMKEIRISSLKEYKHFERCLNSEEFRSEEYRIIEKINNLKGKFHIRTFITAFKVIFGRMNGVPYHMHDSLGDYLFDYTNGKIRNYAEFCELLNDEKSRIRFSPAINFWMALNSTDEISIQKLEKIRAVIILFELLKYIDIKI